MRLDGVEIKVSLGRRQIARALAALDLNDGGQERLVSFVEDATVGMTLPLFHRGVVLRVRQVDGDDDSTVKLRPCRRSQLTGDWLDQAEGDGWKLRVEQDWAGRRRVLAASWVADRPRGRIAAVRAGQDRVRRLFNDGQEQFLADCADLRVNLDALTLLAPVTTVRWKDVRVHGVDGVVVERWTIDDLDFVELSIRTDTVENAPRVQRELHAAVRALDLALDEQATSKTEQVLTHLLQRETSV